MKKILLFIIIIPVLSFAQKNDNTMCFQIKPGTEEWNNLKTEKERINAMQIPEAMLDTISAKKLIDACINFPLFGYYSAYNTPQEGFNIMFSRFNIFNKICKKDSVGQYLIKIYEDAKIDGWQQMGDRFDNKYWTLKLNYLEFLIAQKEVIYKLSSKEKVELLKIAKTKLIQKREDKSFNSISGIIPSLLLISRILDSDAGGNPFKERKDFQHFLETGLLNSPEIIDDILYLTEIYLNQ